MLDTISKYAPETSEGIFALGVVLGLLTAATAGLGTVPVVACAYLFAVTFVEAIRLDEEKTHE